MPKISVDRQSLPWIIGICLGATVLYMRISRSKYVGIWNDDADYILAAQSLLHGSYHTLWTPISEPIKRFWPGFPLFLAPFVFILSPHWNLLHYVSIVLTLVSCILVWRLFGMFVNRELQIIGTGVFACHPLTVTLSGAVMTEPLFLTLVLIYMLCLDRLWRDHSWITISAQAGLLAWIILTRPIGFIFVPATLLAARLAKRERLGLYVILLAVLIVLPCPIFMHHQTGSPTQYLYFWQQGVPLFRHYLLGHVHRLSYLLFSSYLLGTSFQNIPASLAWSLLFTGLGMGLCGLGFLEMGRAGLRKPLKWCIGSYVVFYVMTHSFWLSLDERYFLPVLPFLLLFFLCGLAALGRRLGRHSKAGVVIVGILWALFVVRKDGALWDENKTLPRNTLSWIQENTPSDVLILGLEPFLYLYTGRKGMTLLEASDKEAFRYDALKRRLGYVVLMSFNANMPLSLPSRNAALTLARNQGWVRTMPHAFRPVYQNGEEDSAVYRVLPDSNYVDAYELYRLGVNDLQEGRTEKALAYFEKCLKKVPDLASAWSALGIIQYIKRDFRSSENDLMRALQSDPQNSLALLHLARIHVIRHDPALAKQYYERAIAEMKFSDDYRDRLPSIIQEATQI